MNTKQNSIWSKIKRPFLVLLFLYFISMMIVMGNGHAFLGRYFSKIYLPVASSIGLNTTWNFFSPDPAHTMYIRYVLFYEDENGNTIKEPVEAFWPESQDRGRDFQMNIRRMTYIMRWMILDAGRVEKFMGPYLCRLNPEVSRIHFDLNINKIPSLDKVVALSSTTELYELIEPQVAGQTLFECPKGGEATSHD